MEMKIWGTIKTDKTSDINNKMTLLTFLQVDELNIQTNDRTQIKCMIH